MKLGYRIKTSYRVPLVTVLMPKGLEKFRRLGGLSYLYLKRKLEQWGEGYHVTAQFPMPQVAVKLSPDTIEALASYLSFVK